MVYAPAVNATATDLADPYDKTPTNPILYARDEILTTKGATAAMRTHATSVLDKLKAQTNGDVRQQVVVAGAASAYWHSLRCIARLKELPPETKEAERCTTEFIRMTSQMAKLLRLAGLKQTTGHNKKGGGDGSIFTAPRLPSPTESESKGNTESEANE